MFILGRQVNFNFGVKVFLIRRIIFINMYNVPYYMSNKIVGNHVIQHKKYVRMKNKNYYQKFLS